jgi:hypothetical protein
MMECLLLKFLFSQVEVDAICPLIICTGRQPNVLVWVGTKNGSFIVRSAYHLAKDMMAGGKEHARRVQPQRRYGGLFGR